MLTSFPTGRHRRSAGVVPVLLFVHIPLKSLPMRKSFYLLGLSCMLLTAACSSDDAPDGPVVVEKVELRATFEQIKGQDARQWPEGARVSVNAREYALSSGAGDG